MEESSITKQPVGQMNKTHSVITQIINEIFQADLAHARPKIEAYLSTATPEALGDEFENVQMVLRSLWEYFEALRMVRSNADFNEAVRLFQSAAGGFEKAGQTELRDLATAMTAYAQATIEFYNFNIKRALDLFAAVREHLNRAGKFGSRFQSLIDHMEPDSLFAAGVNAIVSADFETGGVMIEKAAVAAERVAVTYYGPADPLHKSFKGMAAYHRAYFQFFSATHDFDCFKYDKIANADLSHYARDAKKLLDEGDRTNAVFMAQSALSEAFAEILETIQGTAKLMQSLLKSSFKQDVHVLQKLRGKAEKARELIIKAGPQAVPFIRLCNDVITKIDSIERLARPDKKDFGAYSGMISCALFLPLFLMVSWANVTFNIGLEANRIILSSISLALIGGFGLVALKFKGLFFGK